MIPEYIENHGAASGSIRCEGLTIYQRAIDAFLAGDMKVVSVVLSAVGENLDKMYH